MTQPSADRAADLVIDLLKVPENPDKRYTALEVMMAVACFAGEIAAMYNVGMGARAQQDVFEAELAFQTFIGELKARYEHVLKEYGDKQHESMGN